MTHLDWRKEADFMVATQIESRGVRDKHVLAAMKRVPRHLFVFPEYISLAYFDAPLPIGKNQTISQPYMVARMTELLRVSKGMSVLEVGTGSGYQAAILEEMGASVVSLERIEFLAQRAEEVLSQLGYSVMVVVADGRQGYAPKAPYDGILVTAAADIVEEPWQEQLAMGGRIVLPLSIEPGLQRLLVMEKKGEGLWLENWYDYCRFVPVVSGISKQEIHENNDT
ncbi:MULTISPECIES: protein-L-isoaspartate(D-aspartate) O-methyltransferase [Aminobacterium]|jgi:protein-L-isoaspartate(D-aspartate) O-methyltransferase|uniref:protein-L-isoaspartate(D-aspartate) O-methyltransferase n=1 Tax=Aminobacterium TaxID=81466 RepID=UPI00257E2772|nr:MULTISPECIES: protein-L-isoaspartate(D-aspartate) O-methyltransferase [unclassified Aminobacterium]